MVENEMSAHQLKKRRQLLLVLPLLILPFVTLAFWALGGGRGEDSKKEPVAGINSVVPGANISSRPEDKMSLYAERDRQEAMGNDASSEFVDPVSPLGADTVSQPIYLMDAAAGTRKVEQKLSALREMLDNAGNAGKVPESSMLAIDPATYGLQPGEQRPDQDAQLSRLNRLNEQISQSADAGSDAETKQINTMLDKILAIQHPEQTGQKLQALSRANRSRVFPVRQLTEEVRVPLLLPAAYAGKTGSVGKILHAQTADSINDLTTSQDRSVLKEKYPGADSAVNISDNRGAFYDIDAEMAEEERPHYTLPAVIAETQTLISGGTVKMRLTRDALIGGTLLRKGNFVYGTCNVNGERLNIRIQNIRFRDQLFPVQLTVYDLDGMEGIRIPGAISRDAAKEGTDRALQSMQMMSLDPNVGAQVAAAGLEAAKGLLRKKVKLIRVTVKAGYPVLLLDQKGLQAESK